MLISFSELGASTGGIQSNCNYTSDILLSHSNAFTRVSDEGWRSRCPEGHQSAPQFFSRADELVDVRRVFNKQAGDSQRCSCSAQQQAAVNHLQRSKRLHVAISNGFHMEGASLHVSRGISSRTGF